MPVSLFVRGASLLNADKSILKHQHQPTGTNPGPAEAGQRRQCAGVSLGERSLLIYLSVCLLCLRLLVSVGSCCLFLVRKDSMSPCFSLCVLAQEFSNVLGGEVVNPTTTRKVLHVKNAQRTSCRDTKCSFDILGLRLWSDAQQAHSFSDEVQDGKRAVHQDGITVLPRVA